MAPIRPRSGPFTRLALRLAPCEWRESVERDLLEEAPARVGIWRDIWIAWQTLRVAARFRIRRRADSGRLSLPAPRRWSGLGTDASLKQHGDQIALEVRWAWRGLRSRGASALLIILLLGLALAANIIVFASADSFVFTRVPYRDASRLVEIGTPSDFGWRNSVPPETVPVWRSFTDLFSAVHTYQARGAGTYLSGGEQPRFVASAAASPGLLDMLGVRPIAGRLFVMSDAHREPATVAIVAEEIARQEFGNPELALGRTLKMGSATPTIIGVLPSAFRFPSGAERIWTPLDMASQPVYQSSTMLAKMAPGMTLETIDAAVRGRSASAYSHVSAPSYAGGMPMGARSILPAQVDPRVRRLFILLCAAAGCLLLVACANVINLELATTVMRARTFAVEIALGASTGMLVRTALLEGAIVLAAAAGLGAALARQVLVFLSVELPTAMTTQLVKPLAFDAHALLFMFAIGVAAWLGTSLPAAIVALRTNVLDMLKLDARTLSSSRGGTRVRQILTVAEVAITVLLLVGALLNVRSYAALLAIPKGFDTTDVVSLNVRQAPSVAGVDGRQRSLMAKDLQQQLFAAITSRPDVVSATVVGSSPPDAGGGVGAQLQVVGREKADGTVTFGLFSIDEHYFKTMRLPLTEGRAFIASDPSSTVIVDEGFAKRHWPNGDALGARFNLGGSGWNGTHEWEIIGVAAHMRTFHDSVSAASDDYFPIYARMEATNPALGFVVRLSDPSKAGDLTSMVRTLAPGAIIRSDFIRDRYAGVFANEMLAASIMSAFGVFAFLVAIAGIYGVMACLVAGRTREIGIRMALGADRAAINRFVMGSSLRLVAVGAAIGLLAAVAAARFAQSLLFGVSVADPRIYGVVALAVITTALIATWQPARRAARIDPSTLFRN
jgi:predicted permease